MTWESETFEGYSFDFARRAYSVSLAGAALLNANHSQELEGVAGASSVTLFDLDVELEAWRELQLDVTFASHDAPEADVWLQYLCLDTRLEHVCRVADPKTSKLRCRIPIGDVRGDLLVRILGVATAGSGSEPGLVVADSEGILVRIDPPAEAFGSGLRTVWDKDYFTARGIERSLTCVDFPASDEPCLYLNSGVQDFQHLLTSKATQGTIAAARQLILDQIEIDTWIAIGRKAAEQMYEIEEDTGDALVQDPQLADAWQGVALQKIAGSIGEGGDDDARATVAGLLLAADGHEELRCRLAGAVSRRKGIASRVSTLASAIGRSRHSEV